MMNAMQMPMKANMPMMPMMCTMMPAAGMSMHMMKNCCALLMKMMNECNMPMMMSCNGMPVMCCTC